MNDLLRRVLVAPVLVAPVLVAPVLVAPALVAAVLAAAVSGCGSPVPAAPTAVLHPAVTLPWPATAPTELQQAVDGGTQPWLLDPAEVASAYAAAAHGWDAARVVAGRDGTSVDLTGPDGTRRTLTMAQPATPGPTGIWTVTADTPTP